MSGPLDGLRVFVPRSPDRAGPLLTALRRAGAKPVAAPLVAIGAPPDPTPMDDAAARLASGGYDWVAVTSGFTVEGLQAAALRDGHTLGELVATGRAARPGSTRVAAVGDATAAALARADVHADFVPRTEQSARGMLADWPPTEPGATVLLPQSDLAEPALATGLTERGWHPHVVTAYTNTPAEPLPPALVDDLAAGRIGAVVLTSGSAARRLAAQATVPTSTLVCCIGPRTAEVAALLDLPAGVVAALPSPEAIVAALTAARRPRTRPDAEPAPEPAPAPAPKPDPEVSA